MGTTAWSVRVVATVLADTSRCATSLSTSAKSQSCFRNWKNQACSSHVPCRAHFRRAVCTPATPVAQPTFTFHAGDVACRLLWILRSLLVSAPTSSGSQLTTLVRLSSLTKTTRGRTTTRRMTVMRPALLSSQWWSKPPVADGGPLRPKCSLSLPKLKPVFQASSGT